MEWLKRGRVNLSVKQCTTSGTGLVFDSPDFPSVPSAQMHQTVEVDQTALNVETRLQLLRRLVVTEKQLIYAAVVMIAVLLFTLPSLYS